MDDGGVTGVVCPGSTPPPLPGSLLFYGWSEMLGKLYKVTRLASGGRILIHIRSPLAAKLLCCPGSVVLASANDYAKHLAIDGPVGSPVSFVNGETLAALKTGE